MFQLVGDAVFSGQGAIDLFKQFREVTLNVDATRRIHFTEIHGRIGYQPEQGSHVMNQDAPRFRIPVAGNFVPVPQHEPEPRVAYRFEHPLQQNSRQCRHRSVQGGPRRTNDGPFVAGLPADRITRRIGLLLTHLPAPSVCCGLPLATMDSRLARTGRPPKCTRCNNSHSHASRIYREFRIVDTRV